MKMRVLPRIRLGRTSAFLMDSGTPQFGWKITCSMSCENIGVGVFALAGDDALGVNDLAVLDDAQRELGDVDPDVEVAERLRHPAPLLHVGEQLARIGRRRRGSRLRLGGGFLIGVLGDRVC